MKPHLFHPAADEEYVQAVQYYADIALELGWRFHGEMERLIGKRAPTRSGLEIFSARPAASEP